MFGIDDAIIAAAAPAVIGGVADIFGQSMANKSNAAMAQAANAFSAEQAQKQMDFQERMRSTQYQTSVEDLKKAGLNPMLAYMHGGAGTPSGAAATGQYATQHNKFQRAADIAQKAVGAANTAMQTQLTDAQIAESISRTGVNDEQRKLISAETILAILRAPNVKQELKNLMQKELLDRATTTATTAQELATRQFIQTKSPEEAKSKTWWGMNVSPYLKDFSGGTSGAANLKFILGR